MIIPLIPKTKKTQQTTSQIKKSSRDSYLLDNNHKYVS